MGHDVVDLLAQIDAEAVERGPAAVEALRALDAPFRVCHRTGDRSQARPPDPDTARTGVS